MPSIQLGMDIERSFSLIRQPKRIHINSNRPPVWPKVFDQHRLRLIVDVIAV